MLGQGETGILRRLGAELQELAQVSYPPFNGAAGHTM